MTNATIDPARTGKRYAMLFAGTGDRWTLNDLENCYRLLVQHYGFAPRDVQVFYFDGKVGTKDLAEPTTHWPNETSRDTYQIRIDGSGTAANFKSACAALANVLQPNDLVFMHLNGHGGFDVNSSESFLLEFNANGYFAGQFCLDLGLLPQHASLLITMQQCYGAGFIPHIEAAKRAGKIKASAVSLACASAGIAYPKPDNTFDCFTWGWVAAHREVDPFGNTLAKPITFDNSGFVEAYEAYNYARKVRDPDECPRRKNLPGTAQDIRLA